jgi:hypothetical protein
VNQKVDVLTQADAAALVRVVFPRHTAKRLARLMGAETATARYWLHRRFSRARRRELGARLLAELDRQDMQERAAARQRLSEIAGDGWVGLGNGLGVGLSIGSGGSLPL